MLFTFGTCPKTDAAGLRSLRLQGVAILLSLTLTGCGGPGILPGPATESDVVDERDAAETISRYRAQYGLGPVALDPRLIRAASFQASANARAGRLSHDIAGTFESRMAEAGFAKRHASENLSAGSTSFGQVFARWKASPEHNRNMLVPQLKRVGIARVDAPATRYHHFWALVMAAD